MKIKKSCSNCRNDLECIYDGYSNIKGTEKQYCDSWIPDFEAYCELINGLPK